MRRRAFLAVLAGVGAVLSPLGAMAKPRKPNRKPVVGTYADLYSETY